MKEYTEMFEYAREMVKSLIDVETKVNPDEIYDDSSWMVSFFNANLSQIRHPEVAIAIDKLLSQDGDEGRPYSTMLARVRVKFTEMCTACGRDFIDKLIKNTVDGLGLLNGYETNVDNNPYTKAFKKHPELIVSVLGNHYFTTNRIQFRMKKAIMNHQVTS